MTESEIPLRGFCFQKKKPEKIMPTFGSRKYPGFYTMVSDSIEDEIIECSHKIFVLINAHLHSKSPPDDDLIQGLCGTTPNHVF